MKILLAVDGSEYAEAAAKSVAERPWPADSEVKIVAAIEPFQPHASELWAMPSGYWDDLESSARQQAKDAIAGAARQFDSTPELKIDNEILKGNPKAVIPEEAEAWGADLIVLGSHGYTGLKRMLLGSVSQAVLSHAPCSVEIIHRREDRPAAT